MAKKKRHTTTHKKPSTKHVKRKRTANKLAAKKSSKPARKGVAKRKTVSRARPHTKKRKSKPSRARKPVRKATARKKPTPRPRAKPAKRTKRQTREQREISGLREQVRKLHEVVEDRKRERKSAAREEPQEDTGGGPIAVPKGAIDVKRDDEGNVISFELPSYAGEHFDEIDFDYDWDDIIDEYGDEEQDQYAEDAG